MNPKFSASPVAKSVPFNGALYSFAARDTEAAIVEARAFVSVPVNDQSYYVSKQGNDTTGNGSIGQPYLTIAKAFTSITDSSPTKRYTIFVGPGDYPENLTIKANVFVHGSGPIATRITGTAQNINDTTWNVSSADNRSGFQDISLNGTGTWDFTAQAGNTDGKLYFYNVRSSGVWTFSAQNAINQVIVRDVDFFGNWIQNGMNAFVSNSTWQSGSIAVNNAATNGIPAQFTVVGGRITSSITATWTTNSGVTVNLAGINIGVSTVLTATGAQCIVNANDGSLPVPANRSFTSSAILNRINDDFARGLLSASTNVDTSASVAPAAGQTLVATGPSAATWQDLGSALSDNGDGSDGNVTISSGTTVLARDMYYDTLTVSGTGVLNSNGWKIYARTALIISGGGAITNNGSVGGNASAGTIGNGGAGGPGNSLGAGQNGTAGGAFGSNTNGSPGAANAAITGYGGNGGVGGLGGDSGSHLATGGAGGTSASYLYIPERVIRHDPLVGLAFKSGGEGGTGGGGGASSLLATAGAGAGGGGGGGVVQIFCKEFNNTSSVGITAIGGNGGVGGTATGGNSGSGGGGAGGGGGYIHVVCQILTALGTLNVSGGTGGATGAKAGGGFVGTNGAVGSTGHTAVVITRTNTWTVT